MPDVLQHVAPLHVRLPVHDHPRGIGPEVKKLRIAIVAIVLVAAGMAVQALAKPPGGGGGGGTQNCKIVSCAQCPEGYVLSSPQVWPNCCNCIPAP